MSVPVPQLELSEFDEPTDGDLIAAVRAGDREAYGTLYRRHAFAAYNLARQLTRSEAERDDLVAEAFAKVLDTLRAGGGPDVAFRAYLLTTLRNTLYDRARRDRRLELSDDMSRHDPGEPWVDTAVAGLEATLAARAFARLPERWQTVLWHTEVEQETPAEVAPVLGLSPNGVAALAYRAREGLRQAYLQEHLVDTAGGQCRPTVERLGAWARRGLSRRDRGRVERHLESCPRCRLLAGELADVNSSLRGIIVPAVLGSGALAATYLSAASEAAVGGVAGAGGMAGAGGVAGQAAGAAAGAGVAAGGAAGGAAAGGGSLLGTMTGWVVGTQVGQVSAAAIAAVVVGGAAVVGLQTASRNDAPAARPAAGAPATPGLPGAVGPGTGTGGGSLPGLPGASGQPGESGAPVDPGAPGGSGAAGAPGVPGEIGGDPETSGSPGGADPSTGAPGRAGGVPAGPPDLEVGPPGPVRPLRPGQAGEVDIAIRNAGNGPAVDLTAVVSLPAGFIVWAGGSNDPDEWSCTGAREVATCSITELPAGGTGTVRVRVRLAMTAESGPVTGEITAAGIDPAPIPVTVVDVEPS